MAAFESREPTPLHGQTQHGTGLSNPIHNLVQILSVKLDSAWRYDRYAQDCGDDQQCSMLFERMKQDDLRHIEQLREEIERHCKEGSFH